MAHAGIPPPTAATPQRDRTGTRPSVPTSSRTDGWGGPSTRSGSIRAGYSSIVIDTTVIEVRPQAGEALALLAAVADPVRWRLLAALADGGTHCVCELKPIGAVAANVLSYHLKVLREAGLVTAAKRGRWVDYTLATDAHARISEALPTVGTGAIGDPGSGG